MIPSKRPSPFTRAKSFQTSSARKCMDAKSGQDTSSPPFAKRTFTRTMSSPFQVVSPTMASTKNPFEKLSQSSAFAAPFSKDSASLPEEYSSMNIKENDDSEDEIMDPNKTLQMFSFSQPSQPKADPDPEESDDEDDEEDVNKEVEQHIQEQIINAKKAPPFDSQKRTRRPHLQEALEMSLNRKLVLTKELEVPTILTETSKKPSTKFTKRSAPPLDWTLKTSLSITSPDDLSWCDQRSSSEDIAALQWFNSEEHQKSRTLTADPESARKRLLAAAYHWTYPTNVPSIPQVQSINRLLKSATNMTASEKASISEMFSRSSEWKQSFTALYQSYRNGACTHFYYVSKTWTILFQHGSLSLSGELEATLTYSTPGLRKVLRDEEIGFVQLPDITGVKAVHSFSSKHDLEGSDDDEPVEISNLKGRPSQIPKEKGLSDTLLFQGNAEVHGLFTYLLNLKASYEDGFLYQSPCLISSTPFLHAALKRAQISKCRVVNRPVEGSERVQKEYRVEIQGTLLPLAVQVLWTVFADRLATGCSFNATSDSRSHGLNLRPLHGSSSSDDGEILISPKALDQLRFDKDSNEYAWPTVDKGVA